MSEDKATYLATRSDAPLATWAEMKEQAAVLVASRFLPKAVDTPEKALAIMLAGREMGIPPMTAIRGLYVVDGKVGMQSQLMLALTYRTREMEVFDPTDDATSCTVRVKRRGFDEVVIVWTDADTARAGIGGGFGWQKYPRIMRRWRAVAEALRLAFPDVLAGVYTPDELGLGYKVEGGDLVIDVDATTVEIIPPAATAKPAVAPAAAAKPLDRKAALKAIENLINTAHALSDGKQFNPPHLANHLEKYYKVRSVTALSDADLILFGQHLRKVVAELELAAVAQEQEEQPEPVETLL